MKLTTAMRNWLVEMGHNRAMSTYATVMMFMHEFRLTPEQAGEALAEWVKKQR